MTILGLDFGTSNTSAAVYDGQQTHYIPLGPTSADPTVLGSLIYISRDHHYSYGEQAKNNYLDHMLGRDIEYKKEDLGELEMVFSESKIVERTFAHVETNLPGRLFQFMKKHLGSDLETNIFKDQVKLVELIGNFLGYVKRQAEEFIGNPLDSVVLGRPVYFNLDPMVNEKAEDELKTSAKIAGFNHIHFEYEPVAAALNYTLSLQKQGFLLIFDFGGGTFDTSVVEYVPGQRQFKVLGVNGIPLGGSDFDRDIMYEKITPHFGRNQTKKGVIIPSWVYVDLKNWQHIAKLYNPKNMELIDQWIHQMDDPTPFEALKSLITEDHGFAIFQNIEQAKQALSFEFEHSFIYQEGGIDITQLLTRVWFEELLTQYIDTIETCIDETLKEAQITADQITKVARIGGSSCIPFFFKFLQNKFGSEKVVMQDELKNVAGGLAVKAFEISK